MSNQIHADDVLLQAILLLRDTWENPEVGIVAAAIVDPRFEPVFGVSLRTPSRRWLHAERNVLQEFENRYGVPGQNALMITTLSPCTKVNSLSRAGKPCAQLLMEKRFRRVHTGCIDLCAAPRGDMDYRPYGFELSLTDHPVCKRICDILCGLFSCYGQRINSDIERIKADTRDSVFAALDNIYGRLERDVVKKRSGLGG